MKEPKFGKIKNILIVRLSALGDVVMTLPAVYAIRKKFPDAYIAYATQPEAKDILECFPYIDEIILADYKKWKKRLLSTTTFREIFSTIKKIKSKNFDVSINLHILFRAAIISCIASPVRIGYGPKREFNHILINHKIPYNGAVHSIDLFLNFAKYLGANTDDIDFDFHFKDTDIDFVEKFLEKSRIQKDDYIIIISPGASRKYKMWSFENYAKLIDLILNKYSCKIILTGDKNEIDISKKIYDIARHKPIIATGKINLSQFIYLLKRSNLVVGNDSAPIHIAEAVNTPVVAIFGPANPTHTGPYRKGNIVVRKELSCSSCYSSKCKDIKCLNMITPEEVFEKVSILLDKLNTPRI